MDKSGIGFRSRCPSKCSLTIASAMNPTSRPTIMQAIIQTIARNKMIEVGLEAPNPIATATEKPVSANEPEMTREIDSTLLKTPEGST